MEDGRHKTLRSTTLWLTAVQNELRRCPKWGSPRLREWKARKARKVMKTKCRRLSKMSKMIAKLKSVMLNGALKSPEWRSPRMREGSGVQNVGVEFASGVLSRPVSPKLAHEAVLAKPPYFDEASTQGLSKMRLRGVQNEETREKL